MGDNTAHTLRLPSAVSPALADTVLDTLRETIVGGGLAPGQHLREAELASALEVSRGPVREALTQLEREGLVVLRRHRGAEVVKLSPTDVEEVYTLRLALERLAVERAAAMATPEHFADLDTVLAQMADLREDYEPKEAANLDLAFHDVLYRASGHERLQRSWQLIRSQVYLFLYSRNVARRDFSEIAYSEHTAIRQVLTTGSAHDCAEAIEAHLDGAYRRLIGTFNPDE